MRSNSHYVVVFLSTLPQGERHICSFSLAIARNFYPRSRKGSDLYRSDFALFAVPFLSTLPQGERPDTEQEELLFAIFLSTLPQGERLDSPLFDQGNQYFYPRSRKGSDARARTVGARIILFLSTLPQGERRETNLIGFHTQGFLSTLPQGERLYLVSSVSHFPHFYPRSRKGSDKGTESRLRRG